VGFFKCIRDFPRYISPDLLESRWMYSALRITSLFSDIVHKLSVIAEVSSWAAAQEASAIGKTNCRKNSGRRRFDFRRRIQEDEGLIFEAMRPEIVPPSYLLAFEKFFKKPSPTYSNNSNRAPSFQKNINYFRYLIDKIPWHILCSLKSRGMCFVGSGR